MPRRTTRTDSWKDAIVWAALTLVLAAAIATGPVGCQRTTAAQGRDREVLATYAFRTLRAELPGGVDVLTAHAAAEQTLRARGYAITSSEGTWDGARVEGAAPGSGPLEAVVIRTSLTAGATGISVTVEPWGDETVARAVLDEVLARLGR